MELDGNDKDMRAKQYRPTFFTGFTNKVTEFNTVDELLNINFVKSWSEDPDFHRYSLSQYHLMAEFHNGREWWVICFIEGEGSDNIDLPKFKPIYGEKK